MMEVMEAIEARRSHRAYKPDPLTGEQLDTLLKAALASPSAVNRQPWHFTVVQDPALLKRINDATAEDMMKKAAEDRSPRFADPAFDVFYHAPAVIFISGDKNFYWSQIDCGIAVENLALSAMGLNLGSVIVGMPRMVIEREGGEETKRRLGIPEGNEFIVGMLIGLNTVTKEAHPIEPNKVAIIRPILRAKRRKNRRFARFAKNITEN